jgi:hypothetical protein
MSKMRMLLGGAALALALAASGAAAAQSASPPQTINTPSSPGVSEDVIIAPQQRRATPPDGDPRSIGEKRAHQAAYDKCVLSAKEPDMAHPVDSSPEEYCSQRLGMSDRNSVPNSVLRATP